jgi:dihydrofolate synthase/folylpolyglutamate synthase
MLLGGGHQRANAALALSAWRFLARSRGWPEDKAAELDGLTKAFIPGRLQSVPASPVHGHPDLLLDGAHNPHGMAALGKALAERHIAPAAVIFACLSDKHPEDLAAVLRALSTGPVFVPPIPDHPRALPPRELARIIGLNAIPVGTIQEALALAANILPRGSRACPERSPVLLCGSLYLLGYFFRLRPDCLEEPAGAADAVARSLPRPSKQTAKAR